MLGLLIWENLRRERRRKAVAVASVALGMAVVTALCALGLAADEKVQDDLRQFGANLVLEPRGLPAQPAPGAAEAPPTLDEALLDKVQSPAFFWRNTIKAFAPELKTAAILEDPTARDPAAQRRPVHIAGTWFEHAVPRSGEPPLVTGLRHVHPAWPLFPLPETTEPGRWPTAEDEALGASTIDPYVLARLGGRVRLTSLHGEAVVRVVGWVRTGLREDTALYVSLPVAQRLRGTPGRIDKAWLSAILSPEPDQAMNPETMTPAQREKFDCTPYPATVAARLEAVLPGCSVTPLSAVTRPQGQFLTTFRWLVAATTFFALLTASFGVAVSMHQVILNRRGEIGLARALGAPTHVIIGQFLAESALLAFAGGLPGFALGQAIASGAGWRVLEAPVAMSWVLLPPILVLALVVTAAGCGLPLAQSLRTPPSEALKRYGLA